MTRYLLARTGAYFFVTLGALSPCWAEAPSARDELLRFVPKDCGLCFVVNDLRGNVAQWKKSPWIKSLKESALGKAFLDAPEFTDLLRLQKDLKKHLDVDWQVVRDDVLGDAVVFAYQPGTSNNSANEQGILLLHARRPEVLARLLDNLNRAQMTSGDLKSLETRTYKGLDYVCRVEAKQNHFYLLSGHFFAFTGKEELLQRILEQKQQEYPEAPPVALHLEKAGANTAVASLWINPRSFDADLQQKAAAMSGPQSLLLKGLLEHWKAFDAVVVSFAAQDHIEFKLAMLAREKDLPAYSRGFFMQPARPSDLWLRFPDKAIFSMAARIEGSDVAATFVDFAPADVRRTAQQTLQPLAALAGIDFARDVAPNVGPDWGLCVLPATDPKSVPQVIAALAVRPGPKDIGVDQALYRGVDFLAGLSLFDYNRRHPDDPIRLLNLRQEKVEVKYLANDKLFPPGFEPAWALKGGYLLLATTPEAVARFGAAPERTAASGEAPIMRISPRELAKALGEHRQTAIDHIAAKDHVSKIVATQELDKALSVLNLVERIEIARSSGSGQSSFVLRIISPKEK